MTTFETWLRATTVFALARGLVWSGCHVLIVFVFSVIVAGSVRLIGGAVGQSRS
ncbi:MAG: hypothetical protein OXD50_04505 [Chloroflexi bacterium]|nr:hypothetical protein [Chloroflexota bacterium]